MRVCCYHGIEAVGAGTGADPVQLAHLHQQVQIAVNGAQTDVGKLLPNQEVHLLCARVAVGVFDRLIHQCPLSGVSSGHGHLSHSLTVIILITD